MGLKKLLDLSSLYIDSNGCNKTHREAALQSPETKMDYSNCFSLASLSPNILPKDSMIDLLTVNPVEQDTQERERERRCWCGGVSLFVPEGEHTC